jgi:hypothetical protein
MGWAAVSCRTDLRVVEELARRERVVIAVSNGSAACAAVLAADTPACLDKDADFTDRLAEAVRADVRSAF